MFAGFEGSFKASDQSSCKGSLKGPLRVPYRVAFRSVSCSLKVPEWVCLGLDWGGHKVLGLGV